MRVLLVTGDVVEQRALRSILGQLGHEATVAADGATAEDVLAAETVDVVIGDWQLPDVDGIELCRRVRARHDRDYTYFILLTAGGDRSQARRGMEAGADDYLAKPLDAEALDIALIAAARISALHREQRAAQLQQGRLEGVRLAARTMRHELGNKLAATVLYHELLAERADDTTELHAVATKALRSVREATTLMDQLGRVTRLDVINWGPDAHSTLELVGARA
ncbi:MAG TPA: response regulator [Chloroflexota bacterium]|nr:response regulator [Chloroflexota bacterium]